MTNIPKDQNPKTWTRGFRNIIRRFIHILKKGHEDIIYMMPTKDTRKESKKLSDNTKDNIQKSSLSSYEHFLI